MEALYELTERTAYLDVTLTELDSSTGIPAGENDVKLDCRTSSRQQLGGGYGLPLLYSTDPSVGNEILAVSPVDGGISCVFSFIGTTYYVDDPEMMLRDFKILPDGSILMLYALEDLSPYLQKSGILESDYFPAVFSVWRDGSHIYGVSPRYLGLSGFMVDSSILNMEEEPGIHDLIDSLLSPGKENTVFLSGYVVYKAGSSLPTGYRYT